MFSSSLRIYKHVEFYVNKHVTQSRLFYQQRFLFRRRNDSQDYAKYQLLEIISFLKYKIVMSPTKSISFYAGKWKICIRLRIIGHFGSIWMHKGVFIFNLIRTWFGNWSYFGRFGD